jgi:hypothetical protein
MTMPLLACVSAERASRKLKMTVQEGERFAAKFDRAGFRRDFRFDGLWRGRSYSMKQIEAFAIWENDDWLVISVIVKYF